MNLTIEFHDGSKESFRFPKREDAEMRAVKRLEKVLESQVVMLSLEGEMRIYPMTSIKSIRVSPVPPNFPIPEIAIFGAEPIG